MNGCESSDKTQLMLCNITLVLWRTGSQGSKETSEEAVVRGQTRDVTVAVEVIMGIF